MLFLLFQTILIILYDFHYSLLILFLAFHAIPTIEYYSDHSKCSLLFLIITYYSLLFLLFPSIDIIPYDAYYSLLVHPIPTISY